MRRIFAGAVAAPALAAAIPLVATAAMGERGGHGMRGGHRGEHGMPGHHGQRHGGGDVPAPGRDASSGTEQSERQQGEPTQQP
jgi:Spy/CpxP family protein refolding chaperone